MYFSANTGSGNVLFSSDGTVDGTVDIGGAFVFNARELGGLIYYINTTDSNGLYQFDGTTQTKVANTGNEHVNFIGAQITAFNGKIYGYGLNSRNTPIAITTDDIHIPIIGFKKFKEDCERKQQKKRTMVVYDEVGKFSDVETIIPNTWKGLSDVSLFGMCGSGKTFSIPTGSDYDIDDNDTTKRIRVQKDGADCSIKIDAVNTVITPEQTQKAVQLAKEIVDNSNNFSCTAVNICPAYKLYKKQNK
jgi:hypothetical protein